ncbi:MAG: TlpA family protein disulfide reductase [Deltaproteobacteria bacterium]|nr:MAG: TlpA family protein disulfide reductase [Deltaproteobacteria bacterium]
MNALRCLIAGALLLAAGAVWPQRGTLGEAADPPAGAGASAPHLYSDGQRVTAVWVEPAADGKAKGRRVRIARYDGRRWSLPETVYEGTRILANWADTPRVLVHGGRSYVTFPELGGGRGYALRLAISKPGGGGFRMAPSLHPTLQDAEFGFPSLLPAGEGVQVFWLDGRALLRADGAMMLRRASIPRPDASRIAAREILDQRTCECCATDAVLTSEGPLVVYRDRDAAEIRNIAFLWGAGDDARRGTVHADGWRVPGCPVNGPAVDAGAGEAVVAWFTMAEGAPVVRAAFGTQEEGFERPVEIDAESKSHAPIGRVDVVWLGQGEAIVSWLDNAGAAAAIRLRRVGRNGRLGRTVTVSRTERSRAAGFPRIARQGDALLVVYTKPNGSGLAGRRIPLLEIPALGGDEQARRPPLERASKSDRNLPTWTLPALDGGKVELAPGTPVLVNLWATWCQPCLAEMPHLAALARRFPGVRFVGISVDDESALADVKEVVRKRGLRYEVALDGHGESFRVFGVEFVPATFVFDRKGRRVFARIGPIERDDPDLVRVLERLTGGGDRPPLPSP